MSDPIVIKFLLIALFVVMAVILFLPRRGARPLAIKRLTLALMLAAAIFAVAFPELTTRFANILGVGRGVDLIVYGLVVVFIYHSIASKRRFAEIDQRATELARQLAILQSERAEDAGQRLVVEAPHPDNPENPNGPGEDTSA